MTYNKVEFGILNIYVAQILTLETDPRVVIVSIFKTNAKEMQW